jgi:5-methylcytosine-specific restriction endonuclease McrA
MSPELRHKVRQRADNRCEYCRLSQAHDRYHPFHVEHVIARQHGGSDNFDNLALACHQCNLRKGTNLTGLDPDTGELVRLFNPREDVWEQHFATELNAIIGCTRIGKITVSLLHMNSRERLELRRLILHSGET